MGRVRHVWWPLVLAAIGWSCEGNSSRRADESAPPPPSAPAPASPLPPVPAPASSPLSSWKQYKHPRLDLSFRYPPGYKFAVYKKGAKGDDRLVDLEEPAPPPESDDPPGDFAPFHISVQLLAGARAAQGIAAWTRTHHPYAFEPGTESTPAKLIDVSVAGLPAVLFWGDGGMWPYDMLVVQAKSGIVELAVSYNAPNDPIRMDFSRIVSTLSFGAEQPSCPLPGPGCASLAVPVCAAGRWSCAGELRPPP